MIDDLRRLPTGARLDTDVCIVGAGPAGITLARRLARGSLRVLLLESGGLELEPEPQELNRGEVRGESYLDLRLPRQRVFGGTSVHWTGDMAVYREAEFAPRAWVAASGWPIPYAELARHHDEALEICGGLPWPAERLRDPGILARASMPEGGASWLELRHRQKGAAGPRRFGERFRGELAGSSVRVLLHANVTELVAAERGDHVRSLVVRSLAGGSATVSARAFVLACGGLENPRLLLASDRVVPAGLGNQHDLVGRHFQEHPLADVGQIFGFADRLMPLAMRLRGESMLLREMGPTAELAERERCLDFALQFLPTGEARWNLRREARAGEPSLAVDLARLLPWLADAGGSDGAPPPRDLRRGALNIMLEMEPEPANRVRLGEERDALGMRRLVLEFRFGDSYRRTVATAVRAAVRETGRLAIGRIELAETTRTTLAGGPVVWRPAWHHLGTTRMADDPRHGVVDRDCRVHGVDNLWIAGSSVFPIGGYVNPTVTIVALALRLGEHLEARLG